MSYSYYTQAFWGIEFPKEKLRVKTPNPDWNPDHPYSSKTGQAIQKEFIHQKDSEDIAKQYKVDMIDQYEGGDNVYYGIKLSRRIDATRGDDTSDIKIPTIQEMKNVGDILQKILTEFNIEQQEPKFRLVTQVC